MFRLKQVLRPGISLVAAVAVAFGALAGSGAPAHANTVVTSAPVPAPVMTALPPVTNTESVPLSWSAPANVDVSYYQVFRYQGSGTPVANAITYIGQTSDSAFSDWVTSEGLFWYAVMAVDMLGRASSASNWVFTFVDLPGNPGSDTQPPVAPSNLRFSVGTGTSVGPVYVNEHRVGLTWTASNSTDLWRYLVYRGEGNNTPEVIAYVLAGENSYEDTTLDTDGRYTYHVVAQDYAGNISTASNKPQAYVDTTAPTITITSPTNGQSFTASGTLTVTATVEDAVAGYQTSAVEYFLDDVRLSGRTVQLWTLSAGPHVVRVEATDKAGNLGSALVVFVVNGSGTVSPLAPRDLTVPAYSKSRTIQLSWRAPETGTVTQYRIYRSTGNGTPTAVGTRQPVATTRVTFSDTVPADGTYSYFVVAENGATVSPASNQVSVKVDTVAPVITVTAPTQGKVYRNSGTLTPQFTVTDATSGYENSQVKLYLNNSLFSGPTINLASLSAGVTHSFRVDVTDRAGNLSQKLVTFTVSTSVVDQPTDPQTPADVMGLLTSLRGQIHHGHFTSLMAKLRAGQMRNFTLHIIKHRGRFIAPEAADRLLEALGATNWNIDPRTILDSEIEGWGNDRDRDRGGPGNGNGKGNGNKK